MKSYHVSFDIDFKRNGTSGKLIAFEGIDGSGKTTQVKRIASLLRKKGKTVFITKNPTNGIIGKLLRSILNGKVKLSPVSFQYLYTADRQLQQEEIIAHLKSGEYVLTDRYFWSALAYGLSDKKGAYSNENMLMAAHCILSMYHQQLVPDKTFYLDIFVPTALKRLATVHKSDMYEKKEKLQTIRKEYQRVIAMFPEEITVINAEKPLIQVTNTMWDMLQSLI